MPKQVEAQMHEETKLGSFITLCQSQMRMQGRKAQKKSTIQQFRKLWNPTCEIFATCEIRRRKESLQDRERADKLQDNFATCEMDNFNLQHFLKLHLNLRNPLVI